MLALRQGALRPAVEIIEFIELIQQFLGHFVAFQMTDVQKNLPDSISSPLAGPNRAFKTVQLFLQLRNPRRFFGGRSKVGQLLDNLLKMLVFFAPQISVRMAGLSNRNVSVPFVFSFVWEISQIIMVVNPTGTSLSCAICLITSLIFREEGLLMGSSSIPFQQGSNVVEIFPSPLVTGRSRERKQPAIWGPTCRYS